MNIWEVDKLRNFNSRSGLLSLKLSANLVYTTGSFMLVSVDYFAHYGSVNYTILFVYMSF
jgi:hypothetical protein